MIYMCFHPVDKHRRIGKFPVRVFHKAKYGTLDQQWPISSLVHYAVINKEV